MNKNTLMIGLAVLLFASPLFALEPVATWQAEKAEVSKDNLLFSDAAGGLDLIFKDSGGVSLGEKSPSIGDAKSLTFDRTHSYPKLY